jgi:uncharacterized protein DUF6044
MTGQTTTEHFMNSRPYILWGGILVLLLYFLPFLLLGENSYFTIHDNLDGLYVYHHILAMTGQTYNFSSASIVENVMSGLPRPIFGNGLYIVPGLFLFFKPSTAYIINFILTHTIGFIGMMLLLRNHILKRESEFSIAVACSVLFALIPFYSIYGACIPYQPLLLYAFLNLLNDHKNHWKDYLIIMFYPFYSTTVLTEPFVFIFLTAIFLIRALYDRKFYSRYLTGLAVLFLATCIFDFSIIQQNLFNTDFISSREEFKAIDLLGTKSYKGWWIENFFLMLYKTQYHTGTFYVFPIIVAALTAVTIILYSAKYRHTVFYLIFSILLISFLFASYPWLANKFGNNFHLVKTFQFSRFYFLLPAIWIILFAYCVKEMHAVNNKLNLFSLGLIAIQFFIILGCNTEVKKNVQLLLNRRIDEPICKEYFSEHLFNNVRNYIGIQQSKYRVVSIGMHPSVSLFNGFYTLDGYQYVYDLRYKHKFRQIISKELDKDNDLKNYFDKWGSRCYIFSAELGRNYLYGKNSGKTIENLNLDFSALKEMGCRYILSAVAINNLNPLNAVFEKKFEDKESYWDIYLYKLLD